jgi:hypothetical protein
LESRTINKTITSKFILIYRFQLRFTVPICLFVKAASAPSSVVCASQTQHSIKLRWKEPAHQPPNLPVKGYTVTINNSYFQGQMPLTGKSESDIQGLKANSKYQFKVTAQYAYGSSSSVTVECMTEAEDNTGKEIDKTKKCDEKKDRQTDTRIRAQLTIIIIKIPN